LISLVLLLLCHVVCAEVVTYNWDVEDWVVDFKRPTTHLKRPAERVSPFKIPDENRKGAILINGMYPGPQIEVFENDTIVVNVANKLISEAVAIHWHGIHPVDEPWMDGAVGVTQAPIGPGHNFTYTFRAWPAGTHYWHSHMDGTQSAKGMRGALIVKKRMDPNAGKYDAEQVLVMADEWRDPEVCLKLEGAMAGNDVCSDIDFASLNGQLATGDLQKFDKKYPYPLIEVAHGQCYRLRIIMMASNAENYVVTMAGHNMTLIALDGVDVDPIMVSSINMHIGERADVILCADQAPGYYPLEMTYDYACALTPGNFIPPGFHPVSSCHFYSFLHYNDSTFNFYNAPTSPTGTGGGASPKPVSGVRFDLTRPEDWTKTKPVEAMPEPEEPDARFVVTLGLNGPTYSQPTDAPLTKGRWYMDIDGRRHSWQRPATPLLHTKGECGTNNAPVINIPENATNIEIIINNLSPTAHNIHMHGMLFQVINVADFEWCNINKTACFLMPGMANPCPAEDRGFSDNSHELGIEQFYWGCKYNQGKDRSTQNLQTPLRKDSFQVWQRSWAVIRFKAEFPGIWQFHCHMEQHIPLGMITALNVLPSKQKPVPTSVPTEGPCPVWSDLQLGAAGAQQTAAAPSTSSLGHTNSSLAAANIALRERVAALEQELADTKEHC